MAEFQAPQQLSSADTLRALENAIEKTKASIQSRTEMLDHVNTLQTDSAELEAKLTEVQKTMFSLLHDKIRSGEVICASDYAAMLEAEVEAVEGPSDAKGGEGKK